MEKNQGFLSNFNFPVKKSVIRKDNRNIFGLRKKENALVESSYLPTPLNESDSASDVERKIDRSHQLVMPQRSSKLNKILETSSSNGASSKQQEANEEGSVSISFPPPTQNDEPPHKEKVGDTEIFCTDDENEEVGVQPVSPPKVVKRQPVSDTIIYYSDEEEEQEKDIESSVEEVIPILDSDDEQEIENLNPPERNPRESYYNCSESSSNKTLSNFFNNPPSIDPRLAVRHSDIHRFKENRQLSIQKPEPIKETPKEKIRSIQEEEEIEIGPTDEEDNVIDLTHNDSPEKQQQQQQQQPATPVKTQRSSEIVISKNTPRTLSTQISTPRSDKKTVTNINIKIDLKISIREGSASESSSNNSTPSKNSSPEHTPLTQQNSGSSNRVEKFTEKNTPTLELKKANDDEIKTPVKEDAVIDDDLQEMLNKLYGESWKTPQLLRSCKSSRVRENLRKSIHANNFESFIRNMPADLESTRVTPLERKGSSTKKKDEEFRVPTALPVSSKKTTVKNKVRSDSESDKQSTPTSSSYKSFPTSSAKATPRYLEICDPDTSSSEDSSDDDNYNPNDTWNASSDEDYDSESERIKKQQNVRRTMHKMVVEEELTFVRDESIEEQSKLEKLLEKYEYTKPPQINEVVKKITKRKLFTHSKYEEDEDESEVIEKENKSPIKLKSPKKVTPISTPVQKTISVQTPKAKTPIVTKTKSTPLTTPSRKQLYGPLSFLQSLDAQANRGVCDPNALYYRTNYKSKKHELAEKLFKLYNEKVFDSQLTNVPMKWNKKLLNTAGRCNNSRRNGEKQSLLELSDKVLTSADRLRCTLIHEMCHAASWILNGENGHGAVWKGWAAKANRIFTELPKITVCHDYVIEYRYTYLCINCRAQSKTHSKSRKVDEIQCSICKGSIQLFENKKNAAGEIVMIPVEKKELKGFAKFVQLNFKEVKQPNMTHKEVMQILSSQFSSMTVEQKANL